jgi:type VI secretion system protein ImpE
MPDVMNAEAEGKLKEGDLAGALQALQNDVRSHPADGARRIFLFQLLAVMGDWDRAVTQLNVTGDLETQAIPMVEAYREAVRCEAVREAVFAGKRSPLVFGDPERWIALALESVRLSAAGKHDEAQRLRDEAYEDAAETSGTIDDEPFEWIADADTRIGPFLEAYVSGGYYWVPFSRISKIQFEEPADLRDLVWTPAQFTWANGGQAVGLVPSRYPSTTKSADPACLLCRRTEWQEVAEDSYFGIGQRVLATDAGEYSLLDIRTITFDSGDAETDADPQSDEPAAG